MPKNVKLILEQDWGIYSEDEIEEMGGELSKNPKDYEESFYQSDVFPCEMKIIGVIIEEADEPK